MQHSGYPKPLAGARFTLYALRGRNCVRIQSPTLKAVMRLLRALCPGGNCRELLEARS